jgi:hypothetical protein
LAVGASGSIPSGAPTIDDIKTHLSPFEFTRYQQASIIGARDILISLNKKVILSMSSTPQTANEDLEEEEETKEQSIAPSGTTTQDPVPSGIKSGRRRINSKQSKD